MTEDTRRALEIIKPIAKELNVKVDADNSILYLGDQAIGIGCNSTYATVMEAIGYFFLMEYTHWRKVDVTKETGEDIRRYWISRTALKKLLEERK